ncbi:hypothetical protein R6Q57_023577 [Mikania cordata]
MNIQTSLSYPYTEPSLEPYLSLDIRELLLMRFKVPSDSTDEHGDAPLYRLGVLADCGEAERARAILVEDTPWTRLYELAELPTYRLITVEFLSTFRYRAHQAAVRAEEDAELPPNIEFSIGGQHFEMSIERFAVHLGIYYEPETVLDDFGQGLM